jgi:hypothetical protein
MTNAIESKPNSDIHHALALAVLALTGARAAVEARATPDQIGQLKGLLEGGAQLALAIRVANGVAHIEFAPLPADHRAFFDNALLAVDGPAVAALAPPESVVVTDPSKLN